MTTPSGFGDDSYALEVSQAGPAGRRNDMSDGDAQPDRLTEERVARNDARFRQANEQIEQAAQELGQDGLLPFLCECADLTCTQVVEMSLAEYEAVRADSRHFLNVPGHEVAARRTGAVVERTDRFVVYETRGHAGDVAERLDARGASRDARAAGSGLPPWTSASRG